MSQTPASHPRKLPRFVRIVRARPRLFLSAVFGVVVILLLPAQWRIATRLLVGWDVGICLYLAFAYRIVARADVARIRRRATVEDEGRVAILVLTAAAALASLGAILAELGTGGAAGRQLPNLALAGLTIIVSWTFTHTIFALHYAHEYYDERNKHRSGLAFPGNEEPDYWDFLYFSFVIGMTSQVSDVGVSCRPIRRTVLAHGIVSFVFNAALLALTVNIAASAI